MCNSGSSALYLAVELLDLPKGSEVITSPVTFSTDIAPLVRAGLVPVFVDVESDTFNVDVDEIEEMITPKTRAILMPNLAGNGPDWDASVRSPTGTTWGDRGLVRRPGSPCAARPPARGPTSRSRVSPSRTSSRAPATAAWCARRRSLRDRASAPPLGSALGGQLYGRGAVRATSGRGRRRALRQAVHLRRDGVELRAVGAGRRVRLQQLEKLPNNYAPSAQLAMYSEISRAPRPARAPASAPGLDTAWLSYLFLIQPDAGFGAANPAVPRAARCRHPHGVDGNAVRQPMMKDVSYRPPGAAFPTPIWSWTAG